MTKILQHVIICALFVAAISASTVSVVKTSVTAWQLPTAASETTTLTKLLNDGYPNDTQKGYFVTTDPHMARAAKGDYNSFYFSLGKQLVANGQSDTIINLSRELNGSWYDWSERAAPRSEKDAYILAWRQAVKTMRSVPGEHFKFLWTVFPNAATVADAWPGSKYVDYVGTDIFDWYGGYPKTTHAAHWQQLLKATPGGLDWIAAFSKATGKPIIIPEWGLDFLPFGGQDNLSFVSDMLAWLKAHHASGLYWSQGHTGESSYTGTKPLNNLGASAQANSPEDVNSLGLTMGGHLKYAGVYLSDTAWITPDTVQPILSPWIGSGYQLVLSVPFYPLEPTQKSYDGPPGNRWTIDTEPGLPTVMRNGA